MSNSAYAQNSVKQNSGPAFFILLSRSAKTTRPNSLDSVQPLTHSQNQKTLAYGAQLPTSLDDGNQIQSYVHGAPLPSFMTKSHWHTYNIYILYTYTPYDNSYIYILHTYIYINYII